MPQIQSILATNIKRLREKRNLTQDELAHRAGIAYSTVAKLEQGAIKNPTLMTASSIASALDIGVEELFATEAKQPAKNKAPEIKFIYFDLNDVMVRFYHRGFTALSHESGARIDKVEEVYWALNGPADKGDLTLEQFNQKLGNELGIKNLRWQDYYLKTVKTTKDVSSFIEAEAKNIAIGILANTKSGLIASLLKEKMIPNVKYAAIIDSSEVKAIKPDEKIYQIAEKAAGFKGAEILLIDDHRSNLAAARRRGWQTLWFDEYKPHKSVQRLKKKLGKG